MINKLDKSDKLIIYNYSSITGEFTHTSEATPSPLEPGEYLIPANATNKQPPKLSNNSVAIFNTELNNWTTTRDYRNQDVFSKETGEIVPITSLGKLDNGLTTIERPSPTHSWVESRSDWMPDSDKERQAEIIEAKSKLAVVNSSPLIINDQEIKISAEVKSDIALALSMDKKKFPRRYLLLSTDNEIIEVDRTQLEKIAQAIQLRTQALLKKLF